MGNKMIEKMETLELQKIFKNFRHIAQIVDWIPVLKKMPVVEISEILQVVDEIYVFSILDYFPIEKQALIFAELPMSKQVNLFKSVS
jgi:magnesium transporter